MKVLEANRKIFIMLHICPPYERITRTERIRIIIFSVIISNFSAWPCVASFAAGFTSTDLENALYAYSQVAGIGSGVYILTFAYILRSKITKLFDRYEEMYDARKSINKMHSINL